MVFRSAGSRVKAIIAVAAFALVCSASVSGANAAVTSATASTPVPVTLPAGSTMSYVVNIKNPNPGQTRKVEKAIVDAGGTVVQSWPEIGVVVAHSKNADFRAAVVKAGKNAVESVGATRTIPVVEGTPTDPQAPWGPGASGWKGGGGKKTSTDIADATVLSGPQDPYESLQWDMTMIGADKAQAINAGSPSILVGVLDSGIDPDHPDLASQIDVGKSVNCTAAGRPDTSATGWNPTTSDHGTHVAGTIAAARNGVGITGVAPGVRLASVKVVNDAGSIYTEYAVCGFMWAANNGMQVTNNSYYVDPFLFWCGDQPDQAAGMEALRRAVNYSTQKGVTNVAAMGNEAQDLTTQATDTVSPNDSTGIPREINDTCLNTPNELDGIISVTSVTQAGVLSSFSNRGLGVADIAAPGSGILSTIVTDNWYGYKNGTSMASPHVAGVAALIKSVHPEYTPAQVKAKLLADATDMPCAAPQNNRGPACVGDAAYNSYWGEGLVNAAKAVQ